MISKRKLGEALSQELDRGYDVVRISGWAFRCYSENIRYLDPDLCDILEILFSMEEDPQFVLTLDQLNKLAEKLIVEGEKEELYKPIPGIQEIASELDDNWLMCPVCLEAWENLFEFGMVRCPRCNNVLHNPRYREVSEG